MSKLGELSGQASTFFGPAIRCVAGPGKFQERHGEGEGEFGIGILTKHKIVERRTLTYKQYKTKTPRNAIACLLSLDPENKRTVWFINTHLGCHTGEEQFFQAKELISYVEDLIVESNDEVPIILVGDTNSPPWFKAIRALRGLDVSRGSVFKRYLGLNLRGATGTLKQEDEILKDAWSEYSRENDDNIGRGGTFPALGLPAAYWATWFKPMLKLDYILYRGLEIVDTEVVQGEGIDLMASDHRPMRARFRFVDGGAKGAFEKRDRGGAFYDKECTWNEFWLDLVFVLGVVGVVVAIAVTNNL